MIYPKDNTFTLSRNPHSLGIQNNMTSLPTYGSPSQLMDMATNKYFLSVGAIKRNVQPISNCRSGPRNNIWGR